MLVAKTVRVVSLAFKVKLFMLQLLAKLLPSPPSIPLVLQGGSEFNEQGGVLDGLMQWLE